MSTLDLLSAEQSQAEKSECVHRTRVKPSVGTQADSPKRTGDGVGVFESFVKKMGGRAFTH